MKKAILELYKVTREGIGNTKEYKEMLKECDILSRRLLYGLNTKQKELVEELDDLRNDMTEEKCRQCFKSGFVAAARLITEAFYNDEKHFII